MEDSRQGNGQSWQAVLSGDCSGLVGLQVSKDLSARATIKGDVQAKESSRGLRSWSLSGTWHGRHFAQGKRLQGKATTNNMRLRPRGRFPLNYRHCVDYNYIAMCLVFSPKMVLEAVGVCGQGAH